MTSATRVRIETSVGVITLELEREKAPDTVENFVQYVEEGFYEGTIFHRVIDGFMIQGGGLDANMNTKNTRAAIKNEADNGLSNLNATLAMARTGGRFLRRVRAMHIWPAGRPVVLLWW